MVSSTNCVGYISETERNRHSLFESLRCIGGQGHTLLIILAGGRLLAETGEPPNDGHSDGEGDKVRSCTRLGGLGGMKQENFREVIPFAAGFARIQSNVLPRLRFRLV